MASSATELINFLRAEKVFSRERESKLQLLSDPAFQLDLRQIGERTITELNSAKHSPGNGFRVYPSHHLNPLSKSQKCNSYDCRISYAENFARRYALFSDKIVLADEMSSYLFRNEQYNINDVLVNIDIVNILLPLIDAGLIDLASPGISHCKSCFEKKLTDFESKMGGFVFENGFEVFASYDEKKGGFNFKSEALFSNPDLIVHVKCPKTSVSSMGLRSSAKYHKLTKNELEILSPVFMEILKKEYFTAYMDSTIAENERSLLINSTRISNLCISHFRPSAVTNFPISSEPSRMFALPYIDGLNMAQVVKLREVANDSLQSLRCLIEERVLLNPDSSPDTEIPKIVEELRRDIAETKKKMIALELKPKSKIDGLFAALGTSMVLYGVASGNPAVTIASVAPIVASVGIMNTNRKEHEKAECEIKSSPAYALLAAKELLQCPDKL